jgi:hypothetical protein
VREDLPDDRGIVQRGDQAQPAQMPRAGQEDAGERMAPDPYLALPRGWLHQARRRGDRSSGQARPWLRRVRSPGMPPLSLSALWRHLSRPFFSGAREFPFHSGRNVFRMRPLPKSPPDWDPTMTMIGRRGHGSLCKPRWLRGGCMCCAAFCHDLHARDSLVLNLSRLVCILVEQAHSAHRELTARSPPPRLTILRTGRAAAAQGR